MNILALDLGTQTGYAACLNGIVRSGVWNHQPSKFDSAGQRYVMFEKNLMSFLPRPEIIFYEEVRNHRAIDAAHVYGGLMAILQNFCIKVGIEYRGVPVGTIKKYATGKGNALKPEMITTAIKLYPAINVLDDNHADALCLLHYAKNTLIS